MTVGLSMLVRDEADKIAATLERIIPHVDHWTVIDTGSVDATREIVQETLSAVPGRLIESPWVGFGKNRTELLQRSQGTADYHLMLDADHTPHFDGERPEMTADSYLVKVLGPMQWRLPLITRDGHPFEYRGAAHSYLASDTPARFEPTDWVSIDGGPGASPEKLERDRILLEASFADDPSDARTVHYLAQTYRDLELHGEAIRFYRLRANMAGFDEETYWARYQLGCLLSAHVSFSAGAGELLRAWQERPTRVEALRALAHAANHVADKYPLSDDLLFVHPSAYKGSE